MSRAERQPEPLGSQASGRLFWLVLAEIALYVALDAVAQSLPPHYSPIGAAESDLAVGPYGYVMTINFLNRGLLSLVFLYALTRVASSSAGSDAPGEPRRTLRGVYLFGIWGVGAVLLAIFPTDVPATPVSGHGAVHLIVAILAFFGGAFGELMLSREFEGTEPLRAVAGPARTIATLAVVLLFLDLGLPFLVPHLAARIGGLTERLFLGTVLLWIAVVSAYLVRPPVAKAQARVAS